MIQFVALLRRQIIESRAVLTLICALGLAYGVLNTYGAKNYQTLVQQDDLERAARRYRHLRLLGGESMDWSTIATEVCWWNHPLVVLAVLGWAIARGSGAIAGEIERGTVDLTFSRPISRSTYVGAQVLFMVAGLICMVMALVAGTFLGNLCFAPNAPPSLFDLLKPGVMVVALGLAVFGYTIPLSAIDVVRWRAAVIAAGVTICGLVGIMQAQQYEGWQWIEKISVFWYYRPVPVAVAKEPLAFNTFVLLALFAIGVVCAMGLTARRDFPSNS